jgi:hypothetical protein
MVDLALWNHPGRFSLELLELSRCGFNHAEVTLYWKPVVLPAVLVKDDRNEAGIGRTAATRS